jgi:hypothetical protein
MEENIFHCGIQLKKTCGVVGYNAEDVSGIQYTAQDSVEVCFTTEEKFPALGDTIEQNLFAVLRLFSVVSHNGKNPLLLYPTT